MELTQIEAFLRVALQDAFDESTCIKTLQLPPGERLDEATRAQVVSAISVYSDQVAAVDAADIDSALKAKTVGSLIAVIEKVQTKLDLDSGL